MDEITKEIIKQADGVALEAYKDIVQTSAKPIGSILSFLPRTVRLLLGKWEKWIVNGEEGLMLTSAAIEDKVKKLSPDKIVEPEPYVVIPAIQQLCYCQNNEVLRNLYANLLVSSMNADKKWDVHPAFVDIIKQLSPDEAKIINYVENAKNRFMPLIDVKGLDKDRSPKDSGHELIITNFTTVGFCVIEKKENICKYVDNLLRLNLFEIPPTYHLTNPSLYETLKNSPVLSNMIEPFRPFYDIDFNYKILVISNLGLSFKRICCE